MVKIELDILEFLVYGKIDKLFLYEKSKEYLIKYFGTPDYIEEYAESNFSYYHYRSFRFLISQENIIESISVTGSLIETYNSLSKTISLLMNKNILFSFDKERSDNDYLFLKVGQNGQIIYDVEENVILRINYPYL